MNKNNRKYRIIKDGDSYFIQKVFKLFWFIPIWTYVTSGGDWESVESYDTIFQAQKEIDRLNTKKQIIKINE